MSHRSLSAFREISHVASSRVGPACYIMEISHTKGTISGPPPCLWKLQYLNQNGVDSAVAGIVLGIALDARCALYNLHEQFPKTPRA